MRFILALILILAPTFASAATLTWSEYAEFIQILNNEIVYIKKLKVNKNIVLAVMEEAEKRQAKAVESYYDRQGGVKQLTQVQYEAKRTDLFTKVKEQFNQKYAIIIK